jgi:hypothetical protein
MCKVQRASGINFQLSKQPIFGILTPPKRLLVAKEADGRGAVVFARAYGI